MKNHQHVDWLCRSFFAAIVSLASSELWATWAITTPTANQQFTTTSNIGAAGTTDQGETSFTLYAKTAGGTTVQSQTGTSSTMGGPNYTWGATLTPPSGGWAESTTLNLTVTGGTGGTSDPVAIQIQ